MNGTPYPADRRGAAATRWTLLVLALLLLSIFTITACSTPPTDPGGNPPPGSEEPPPGTEEPPEEPEEPEEPPVDGPGAWTTLASSGVERQEVAYVRVGNRFFLAGGGESDNAHEMYDATTDTWTDVAPLPNWRDHIQAVAVDGLVYYIGGLVFREPQASVFIYDPQTNTFSTGTPMERPRGAGGVAVHDGLIYYAGGVYGGGASDLFDVYDPVADTWTALDPMPHAREHFHAAVVDGRFYAIGGRAGGFDGTLEEVDVYDFASESWSTLDTALPTPRGGFATAVIGDEILVIGGEGAGNAYDTVEAYDTASNEWRTLTPMPTGRHGIQAVVCNDTVYVAAGGTTQGGSDPTNVHEVFAFDEPKPCPGPLDTFTEIEWDEAEDAPFARAEAQGVAVGDRLYVFGGFKAVGSDATQSWAAYCTTTSSHVLDVPTMEWRELPAGLPDFWTHGDFGVDGDRIHMVGMRLQPGRVAESDDDCEKDVELGTQQVATFDTVSETWSLDVIPPLPEARSSGGVAVVDRHLHFFGGTNADTSAEASDHWAIDLDDVAAGWQPRTALPKSRNHVGVAVLDGFIYVMGGQIGTGYTNTPQPWAHRYDPSTDSWTELAPLPVAQSHVAATIAIGNRILVFGGEQVQNGNLVAAVWGYDPAADTWAALTDLPQKGRAGVVGFFDGDIIYARGEFQTDVFRGTPVLAW